MKVLVTGSRDWRSRHAIHRVLEAVQPNCVVEGGQTGADDIARGEASALGMDVVTYWANWKRHGKAAGPIRNQRMLDEQRPDRVLAFPMPHSVGTVDMMNRAKRAGILVQVFDEDGREVAQESATSAAAVDPHAGSTGKPPTRVKSSFSLRSNDWPSQEPTP